MAKRIDNRKTVYFVILLFIMAYALTFYVYKKDNMDFVRYQDLMTDIRMSKLSFLDYVFFGEAISGRLNHILKFQYGFNALLYLVARYARNDYVMVWISVLIDYSIILYIAYDFGKDHQYKPIHVLMMFFLCYALFPFIHACSGLRMATAASLMALAVYDYLYRNKSLFLFMVLSILSVSFHLYTVFAIPLAIIVRIADKKILVFITFIGTIIISKIAGIFANSNIALLRSMGIKYLTYTSENQFRAYRTFLYGVILLSVIVMIYYLFIYQDSHKTNKSKIYTFMVSYMALLLGNIGSYELVVRGAYLLGAMAPVLSVMILEKKCGPNKELAAIIQLAVLGLALFMSFMMLYHYHQFFNFGIYRLIKNGGY